MKPEIVQPAPELRDFVMCYWILESKPEHTPLKNTIVPDGTMKLIFHYGDTYRHHPTDGESVLLPNCFLIGQLTKPYVVEPLGITGSFFVRFKPNGFLPYSTIPLREMENKAVPLDMLFGNEGVELGEQILSGRSTSERIQIIETFLLKRFTNSPRHEPDTSHEKYIDNVIRAIIESILLANGQFSVNELSQRTNINRRQLTRKFSSAIGLSPKQLSKTIRIQATLKALLNKEVSNLTDLAYASDYFDQAHFIKDFKEFTGLRPREFYGESLKMSLIFDGKV